MDSENTKVAVRDLYKDIVGTVKTRKVAVKEFVLWVD